MNLKETLVSLIQTLCVKGFTSTGLADAISQAIDIKTINASAQNQFDIVAEIRKNPTMRIQRWVSAYDSTYGNIVGGPNIGTNRSVLIEAYRQTASSNADFTIILTVKNGDRYIGSLGYSDNSITWVKITTT